MRRISELAALVDARLERHPPEISAFGLWTVLIEDGIDAVRRHRDLLRMSEYRGDVAAHRVTDGDHRAASAHRASDHGSRIRAGQRVAVPQMNEIVNRDDERYAHEGHDVMRRMKEVIRANGINGVN